MIIRYVHVLHVLFSLKRVYKKKDLDSFVGGLGILIYTLILFGVTIQGIRFAVYQIIDIYFFVTIFVSPVLYIVAEILLKIGTEKNRYRRRRVSTRTF